MSIYDRLNRLRPSTDVIFDQLKKPEDHSLLTRLLASKKIRP
jgi:hypothetical protein